VATAEIRYGDNDRLAARVAQMVGADCLVLLSDIDGCIRRIRNSTPVPSSSPAYSKSPRKSRRWRAASTSEVGSAACRPRLPRQNRDGGGVSFVHREGGFPAPVEAHEDVPMHVVVPSSTPVATRKQWIAGTLRPAGAITVDEGAVRALMGAKVCSRPA